MTTFEFVLAYIVLVAFLAFCVTVAVIILGNDEAKKAVQDIYKHFCEVLVAGLKELKQATGLGSAPEKEKEEAKEDEGAPVEDKKDAKHP